MIVRMNEAGTIAGIRAKRLQVIAELARIELRRDSALRRLHYLDAAIKVMGGQRIGPTPRSRKRRWLFGRGELRSMVCTIIREHGPAIRTGDIARSIIAKMDWDARDTELQLIIARKVKDVRKRLNQRQAITPPAASSLSNSG